MTGLPPALIAPLPRRVLAMVLAGILASGAARAADPLAAHLPQRLQGAQCGGNAPPDPRLESLRAADPNDPHINITSNSGEMGQEGDATLHGDITVRMGQRLLTGDEAQIDAEKRNVAVQGSVEYLDPQLHVRGADGSFHGRASGEVTGAQFELIEHSVRGSAADAKLHDNGVIDLTKVSYTSCPPGNQDWQLRAEQISLDQNSKVGTGRNVRLDFKGVPLFYTPWISFPIGEERKSGLLFPTIGTSGKTGFQLAVPWYWNIAPNLDATFTGRYFGTRGLRIDPEFRYLTEDSRGDLSGEYLAHDKQTGDVRGLAQWTHVTLFDPGTRLFIDAANVSDNNYFEDFGVGFEGTSITFLNRLLELRHDSEHWTLTARTQDYQVLDTAITAADRPYTILPALGATGQWRELPGGLSASLLADAINFRRELGPEGVRLDAQPGLEWRAERHGAFLAAGAAYSYTQYWLTGTGNGETSPSRGAPILSVDSGFVLEREAGQGQRVQTLEPRMLYVYVPYRQQDSLPVFDTALPDLSLVQLFRTNRYVGEDRLGDANQMSVGLTTRLLDAGRGHQFLSATLGQAFYFEQPRVKLPSEPAPLRSTSDMIAELELSAFKNWNAKLGLQWNPNQSQTEQAEVFVQYQPAADQVVNVGYRFRRDLLEQFDVSTAWPIFRQWRGYARWIYSTQEHKTLDEFVGIEYSACCWALRLVTRHYVSSRTGATDTSIGVQLELKGLSNVGVDTQTFLREAIRGYSPLPSAPRP